MNYFVLTDEDFDVLFCKSGPEEIGGAVYSPVALNLPDAVRVADMLGVQFPFVPKRVEELEQLIQMAFNAGCQYIGFVKGFVDNCISLSLQRITSELTSPKE